MRRLATNTISRIRGDEGATLVFVAVILVALLALTAFAVDFGRMYEERRQLQNGADAAALAIAEDCARGLCGAGYDEYATAEIYVDDNARDGSANAWQVNLDLTEQTVTVRNRTEDPGGDNKFDMLFAGIVGFDGFTVGAEATVAWGNLRQGATLPLIISDCEWEKYGLPAGPLHDDPPVYAANLDYTTLFFHSGQEAEPCNLQAGQDPIDGGFGWVVVDDEVNCEAVVHNIDDTTGDLGWVAVDDGADSSCSQSLETMLLDLPAGRTVFIPYFDEVWKGSPADPEWADRCSNQKCYHISGYGAFHIIGYKLSAGSAVTSVVFDPPVDPPLKQNGQPWPSNQWNQKFDCDLSTPSQTDEVCLLGYFVEAVYTGPGDIGGDDRGVKVIKFTG